MCFGTLWTINILLLCPKVVSRIPFHVITVAQDRELVTTNGNVQHLRKNDEYVTFENIFSTFFLVAKNVKIQDSLDLPLVASSGFK